MGLGAIDRGARCLQLIVVTESRGDASSCLECLLLIGVRARCKQKTLKML